MQLRVQGWNAQVAPIAAVRVGTNAHTLMRNRGGESTVGNLVADAIRAAAGTDIAMQNSGGLRADLQEGEITRGSIYEVMPFDNQVFTMGLTGREVRLALEEALKSGRATQVSGIRYTFDPDRAAMDRVVSLTDAKGAALDSAKVYRVAVNDFMATGGDNYDVLAGGLDRTNTQILVRDALEKYIAERSANGPLEYAGDGRVQRVDGKPAPPNNPNAGAPANATPTTPSPTPRSDRDARAAEVDAHAIGELLAELALEIGIAKQLRFRRVVDERGLDEHRRELHRFEHGEARLLHAALLESPVATEVVEQRLGEQLALVERGRALHVIEDADEVVLGLVGHAAHQVRRVFDVGQVLGRLVARATQRQEIHLGAAATAAPLGRVRVDADEHIGVHALGDAVALAQRNEIVAVAREYRLDAVGLVERRRERLRDAQIDVLLEHARGPCAPVSSPPWPASIAMMRTRSSFFCVAMPTRRAFWLAAPPGRVTSTTSRNGLSPSAGSVNTRNPVMSRKLNEKRAPLAPADVTSESDDAVSDAQQRRYSAASTTDSPGTVTASLAAAPESARRAPPCARSRSRCGCSWGWTRSAPRRS
jgi:hypothetical protein